ncbi:MAG: CRISPR-associated endoribonuclease Cas6 [Chitinispirillaceae bacterium]|nr:CRISPR-associated endoribonuclease Cas6 [Chitinispirillaceae bacterium]
MRLICKIIKEDIETVAASDIRRYTLSLLKEAFIRSGEDGKDFYNAFYENNRMKSFTFSTYVPVNRNLDKQDNYIQLIFSTNNYEFLMRVYNGLLTISKDPAKNSLLKVNKIKDFFLSPEKRFDRNEMIFKTVSPFLVRDKCNGEYYVFPKDARIESKNSDVSRFKYWKPIEEREFVNTHLLTSLKSLVETAGGWRGEIYVELKNLRVIPILHGSGNSNHKYKMTYPGIKGLIGVKADPEILKLFYDIGIGARRSEGFGLLEIAE